MIDIPTLITFVLMGCTTWLTRIAGYLLLRNRTLSPRIQAVMTAAPGCVLITVITPYFVTDRPADLIALGLTLAAATRFSFLPTVMTGLVSAFLLRHFC